MRILHVLPTKDPNYGGPVKVAEALSEIARQKNIEATLYPDNDLCRNGNSFLYYPGIHELQKIENLVKNSDIIHIHGLWTIPTSFAAVLARQVGCPYIITPHGMLDRWSLKCSRWKKIIYASVLERRNLSNASAIHFLNEGELKEAMEFGIKAPAFILPNGVDLEEYGELPGRSVLEDRYPELKDKIIVLFLGRLHSKKGLDILIPAFEKAKKKISNLHMIIAGPDEGGYKNRVCDMVTEYSIWDSIIFTGFVNGDEKKALFGGSDFFVLSSYQEGDSIAVKEALASGLPVIITKACHLPEVEILRAGIVTDTDIDEVSKAIIGLSEDTNLRTGMSKNAISLIREKYSWEEIGNQAIEVYQDILENQYSSECWRIY